VTTTAEREQAAALCRQLQPAVFGALALYCGDTGLAEELTQETLLRVWVHWQSVSKMDRPDRWALRVGFNLAKSGWRRRRVERAVAAIRVPERAAAGDPTEAIVVRAAVAALPTRQRAAIVLRYFSDLSVADTAAVLGCAEGTVKALTHQAVANLRGTLDLDLDVTTIQQEMS
jgi:RNA polymerase sigma-70 factor (sigma-E family)